MNTEKKNLKEIMEHRIEKLNKIRRSGHNPYPYTFDKKDNIKDIINKSKVGDDTITAGRIISQRKMGKASFVHIQDDYEKIQLYLQTDNLPSNNYDDIVRNLDLGDIIGCSGHIFITKSKELSIKVNSITMLSKNLRPLPNIKEKDGSIFNAFEDKEIRYRHRQLDLIVNPIIKNIFRQRALIINTIREFLNNNDYLEVETPVLQPIYGGASARPFTTRHISLDQMFYLRIADELYLKRLIIGGFEKVYEIAKNFRNEGIDKNHNPEFTSLEYYQAYADVYEMMDITEELIIYIVKIINKNKFEYCGNIINLTEPFNKLSMFELIEQYTDTDLTKMDTNQLEDFAKAKSIDIEEELNYGQLLDKIFATFVEPNLINPTFVTDYPKETSPLAKEKRDGNVQLVERFELFIAGMEIANSFSELNDPVEQRCRLESQHNLKLKGDEEAQNIDENFIQAMEAGMPPMGGVGIGIDRLVMLLTQKKSIKDVILFPTLRSEP